MDVRADNLWVVPEDYARKKKWWLFLTEQEVMWRWQVNYF
jgi:hypothetical protein